ncbi:hypothetical protein H2198_003564 [Neophaeococcomyces mojaviensis]|uniref:Uncharacterized protein n=1 Tax=Neophaeococcomyces mojaviensis TaxID=3383035 RepID=A0ACC3AB83_9EURO|nr:hypothetical protein H2198_003564 [Knufia sp. JES_112]
MAMNQFIFVNLSPKLPAWTIDGNPITTIPWTDKVEAFRNLALNLQNDFACELVAELDPPGVGPTRKFNSNNTFHDLHAEENLFVNMYNEYKQQYASSTAGTVVTINLPINSILISLEPCHDKRYGGHSCIELFKQNQCWIRPKKLEVDIKGSFVPAKPLTFVFFIQMQTPKGETGTDWKTIRLQELQGFKTVMGNLLGPPPNTVLYKLGRQPEGSTFQDRMVVTTGSEWDTGVDDNKLKRKY